MSVRAKGRSALLAGSTAAACLVGAAGARADAIDGEWCSPDGRRPLSIDGPRIVTPGGATTTGDSDRHGFAYVVPPVAPAARMVLGWPMSVPPSTRGAVRRLFSRCQSPMPDGGPGQAQFSDPETRRMASAHTTVRSSR